MKKLFLYPAIILAFTFTACNDTDPIDVPLPGDTDPKNTYEYFVSLLDDMRQEFTFDNDGDKAATIKGKDGIEFTIEPGTFTIDGEPVEGEVKIVLYEMMSMSSIAFSGTNTNYAGGKLGPAGYFETDGFFNINATADGRQVDRDLALNIGVKVPNKLRKDATWTMLWEGTEKAGDNGDLFAWEDPQERDQWEVGGGVEDFEFDLGKLGWCNCDVLPGGQYTLTVTLTGTFGRFANFMAGDGETYVMFCKADTPVLAQLYNVVDESTVKSYDNGMPAGKGRLFAFSILDGVYTYAEKEIDITEDMTVILDMEEVDKDYIDKRLKSLDGYN